MATFNSAHVLPQDLREPCTVSLNPPFVPNTALTPYSMAKPELPTDLHTVFGRDAEIQKVVNSLTANAAGRVAILGAAGG